MTGYRSTSSLTRTGLTTSRQVPIWPKGGGTPPKQGGTPPQQGITRPGRWRTVSEYTKLPKMPIRGVPGGTPKMAKNGQKRGQKGQIGFAEKASVRPILCCVALPGTAVFVGRFDRWGTEIVQNTPPSEKKIVLIPTSSNFKILLALY